MVWFYLEEQGALFRSFDQDPSDYDFSFGFLLISNPGPVTIV